MTGCGSLQSNGNIYSVFEANPGPRELLEAILKQVQVAKKVSEAAKARDEMQAAAAAAVTANTGPTQPTQPTQNPNANPALLPSAALPTGTLESKRLLDFCDTITKAVTQIDKALKQTRHGKSALKGMNDMSGGEIAFANADSTIRGEAANNITTLSDEVIKERYVAWAKSCNYSYHDWEFTNGESAPGTLTVNYKHVYSDDAGRISSYPARNTALMKEVRYRIARVELATDRRHNARSTPHYCRRCQLLGIRLSF